MRSPKLLASARSFASLSALLTLAGAAGGQILNLDSDSITTYLATSTTVQGVRPLHLQRIVNVEGSQRAGAGISAAIAGNPSENAWRGTTSINGVMLATGAYSPTDIDISLPTEGFPWVIGRSYNAVQETSAPAAMDSNGYQGQNWFQLSQPEIVLHEDTLDHSKDTLYLVLGADRFAEYKRYNSTSVDYSGRNGATGCFTFVADAGGADTWVLTDTRGTQFTFFGSDGGAAAWQLWKVVDANGNTAYVGDASTKSTAISNGYDASGRILTAYDASDRRFTYTYTTLDSVKRLTQVKAETKSSGTWASPSGVATVAQVDYAYYVTAGAEAWGQSGDLKQVTITKYLSDGTTTQTLKKYYRYWEGTYDSTTNPGYDHALAYVYDFEGIRRFDWADTTFDEDFLTATENSLKPYASAYFEYDSSHRVREAWFNGSCGCGGGAANGTTGFSYVTNLGTPASGYEEEPRLQTVVAKPDGGYLTQYFDETGQTLSRVVSDGDPSGSPNHWVTAATRNSDGMVTSVGTPKNATAYTHSTGAITSSTSVGLVHQFARVSGGSTNGFLDIRKHSVGTSGTAYYDEVISYDSTTLAKTLTNVTVCRPVVTSRKVYSTEVSSDSGAEETTYSFTEWSGTDLAAEQIDMTPPTVSTGKNGSNSGITTSVHLRKDGLEDYRKQPWGSTHIISYRDYSKGQETTKIVDANTGTLTEPTGFTSAGSSVEVDKRTDTSYTSTGLRDEVTPAGASQKVEKQYVTRLLDQRLVQLDYAAVGSGDFYGPVQYRVLNQAGKVEVSGVIGLVSDKNNTAQSAHIDEGDADPITAVDTGSSFGSLMQMTTSIYDESGTRLTEERRYFSLPGSGAGSAGTNYDATKYAYDDEGHRIRTKEASGTIRRTTYDIFDRVVDQYIGTNDYGSAGGESSGPANMVKTEHLVFDGGSAGGNGHLTSRTLYVEDSTTDQRVTTYLYDDRGRRIVELPPAAPYTLTKYDNQNRAIAVAQYSSSSGLDETDDPTSLATNRMTLNETFYDEAGRVWKTLRHKIDDADGSDDGTLETLTWYDDRGQVVKVDGNELKKTRYDRMGRVTDEFILAVDNDSTYADVDDVSGDIVLEQRQTRYDPVLDTVTFRATISRFNTDYGGSETTGELDTNADAEVRKLTDTNIKGRLQVTGYWYDRTKREKDRCNFGTNGGSTLDFTTGMGNPPSRSDTELVSSTTYNLDGTIDTTTDPMGHVTKNLYDDLGRKTKEIRHYDVGVNSGDPYGTDDNVTVAYAYANGLRTTLTADTPGTDQVTTYTYGTTKSASAGDSKIATGHLLQKVTYPDSGGSTDVVTYAYNAQSQEMWKKDQGGNVYESDYDDRGRRTEQRVTTLGSGFDGAVRRIETTYDVLGRTQLVTQYDNSTVGSGSVTDEVKYTYNDWGLVEKFEQDRDGVVGGGGAYEVSYSYGGVTAGRNAIVKTQMVLPGGDYVGYAYLNTGGIHDLEVGRVTCMFNVNQVRYAQYSYNGVAQVVDTDYWEPDVRWKQYTGSGVSATYPDLDNFNRVIHSRWERYAVSSVDFYSVDLTYDRDSSIVSADDNVQSGFDVKYTIDDIDRLVKAEEGTLSAGSITSRTRDQEWTLSHTGNWDVNKVDLNGDDNWSDAGEENDTRAHNAVNEITTRLSGTKSLSYDAAGNLTDDGVDYKYEWDAFYRLRKVKDQSSNLVAEYRYNGLGYRIGEHVDTDTDGDVDGSDLWYYDAFDENWRQVAHFRSSDTDPKEEFVAHQAGLDGRGGSSYIDLVAVRNKDADTAWTSASDGVLEERIYYCQNQHADVVALINSAGEQVEQVRYSAYGIPFGLPAGDTDSDGDCDSTDEDTIKNWSSGYDVRSDIDVDGDVDGDDYAIVQTGVTLGRTSLSAGAVANQFGYAGGSQMLSDLFGARNRVCSSSSGRWLSRDPLASERVPQAYWYVGNEPLRRVDPFGKKGCTLVDQGVTRASNVAGAMIDIAVPGAGLDPKHTQPGDTYHAYSVQQSSNDCTGCTGWLVMPSANVEPNDYPLWHGAPSGGTGTPWPQWHSDTPGVTVGEQSLGLLAGNGSSELRNVIIPISMTCGESRGFGLDAQGPPDAGCAVPHVWILFSIRCTSCDGQSGSTGDGAGGSSGGGGGTGGSTVPTGGGGGGATVPTGSGPGGGSRSTTEVGPDVIQESTCRGGRR